MATMSFEHKNISKIGKRCAVGNDAGKPDLFMTVKNRKANGMLPSNSW